LPGKFPFSLIQIECDPIFQCIVRFLSHNGRLLEGRIMDPSSLTQTDAPRNRTDAQDLFSFTQSPPR
jgi:hypothetical protein